MLTHYAPNQDLIIAPDKHGGKPCTRNIMNISAIQMDERVKTVYFTEATISVDLMDGRTITVPLVWYPRLLNATPDQRQDWEICGGGYGLHWEDIQGNRSYLV